MEIDLACPKCQGTEFRKPAEAQGEHDPVCTGCGFVFDLPARNKAALDQALGQALKSGPSLFRKR